MKKLISMLLVVFMLVTCMATTAFAAEVGDTVEVAVTVSGNPGFGCYTVNLSYDTTALKLVSLSDAGCISAGKGTFLSNAAGNCASFFVMDLNNVTGDGNLFIATFEVLDGAKAGKTYNVSASFEPGSLANANNEDISMGISGGSVTIDKPVCNHVWDEGKVTKDATCTEDGVKTYTCTVPGCGETKTEVISATGHKFGEWKVTKTATCTEKGEETRECACGEKETREIAATGHKFGEWKVTKAATCTEKGEETRECACGEKEVREIPVKEHALNTYGKDSTHHWVLCDNCDHVGEKEAHDYDYNGVCVCGATKPVVDDPNLDDIPQTGDITPYIAMTFVSIMALAAAAAFVLKRKAVK